MELDTEYPSGASIRVELHAEYPQGASFRIEIHTDFLMVSGDSRHLGGDLPRKSTSPPSTLAILLLQIIPRACVATSLARSLLSLSEARGRGGGRGTAFHHPPPPEVLKRPRLWRA